MDANMCAALLAAAPASVPPAEAQGAATAYPSAARPIKRTALPATEAEPAASAMAAVTRISKGFGA